MSTYREWNQAIIDFTTKGIPRGDYVFLHIDEEVIDRIGIGLVLNDRDALIDFKRAVRAQCIGKQRIELKRVMNPLRNDSGIPRYVAFLAAMVLAAHYMGEDEDKGIHNSDYFRHLNDIFGLNPEISRAGIKTGAEKILWDDWRRWLGSQGYLSALQAGKGAYIYTGYPISQTLLRQSDKDKLWRYFGEHQWSKHLDEDILMSHIRSERRYLTKHLSNLLNPEEPHNLKRYDSLRRACYEVYESWVENGGSTSEKRVRSQSKQRTIRCGILRQVDPLFGTKDYFLYPRQIAGVVLEDAEVIFNDESYALVEDRSGWFSPLWQLDENHWNGFQAKIYSNHSTIRQLELPRRNFWILTSDPDIPESDTFASWRSNPVLGEPFILLCRIDLKETVQRLRNEGLIDFSKKPEVIQDGWLEYEHVLISSEPAAWQGIKVDRAAQALLDILQPRLTFKMSLRDGLRVPGRQAWIAGHGPVLTVSAFYPEVAVQIIDIESDDIIFEDHLKTGELTSICQDKAGNFLVMVSHGNITEERIVQIVDWDELGTAPPPQRLPAAIQKRVVFGAMIQEH